MQIVIVANIITNQELWFEGKESKNKRGLRASRKLSNLTTYTKVQYQGLQRVWN